MIYKNLPKEEISVDSVVREEEEVEGLTSDAGTDLELVAIFSTLTVTYRLVGCDHFRFQSFGASRLYNLWLNEPLLVNGKRKTWTLGNTY